MGISVFPPTWNILYTIPASSKMCAFAWWLGQRSKGKREEGEGTGRVLVTVAPAATAASEPWPQPLTLFISPLVSQPWSTSTDPIHPWNYQLVLLWHWT